MDLNVLANLIVEHGLVTVSLEERVILSSGIESPVYFEGRKIQAFPGLRKLVQEAFFERMCLYRPAGIAGVAHGASPHSVLLADRFNLPHYTVRKERKERGTRSLVDGAPCEDNTAVIEDVVTTGASLCQALSAVRTSRPEHTRVEHAFALLAYGAKKEPRSYFRTLRVNLHALLYFEDLMRAMRESGRYAPNDLDAVVEWQQSETRFA